MPPPSRLWTQERCWCRTLPDRFARSLPWEDDVVQILVRRTPALQGSQSTVGSTISSALSLVAEIKGTDFEDLAIDRVMSVHALSGSGNLGKCCGSLRLAHRGTKRQGYDPSSDDEEGVVEVADPPPAEYTCHRCGTCGGKPESHWSWECPELLDDPNYLHRVRTVRGVPRAFLKKVGSIEEGQALSHGGVTFRLPGHTGHYIISHQESSSEDKRARLGDSVQAKLSAAFSSGALALEDGLSCPLCHRMLRQAVLAPCCGRSFCGDCAIDRMAHTKSGQGRCPGCRTEVLAHQLIANEAIRKQVEEVTRASQVASRARELQADRQAHSHLPPLLEPPPAPLLALEDGGWGGQPEIPSWDGTPWSPLALGARLLSEQQFAAWKSAVRSTPSKHLLKRSFEDAS